MFNRNPHQVRRTGLNRSTPGDIRHAVSVVETPSPVLIGTFSISPPCDINTSQQVANKWQSTSPTLVGNTQKFNAAVDGKFPNDLDSAFIFSKVIGHKLSDDSSDDFYTSCRMNFAADPVQNQILQFMDLGFSTINTLYESSGIITPAAIIRKSMDGAHWSALDHVFGEAKAVGMNEVKSYHDYKCKTELQIWTENK